MYNLTYEQEGSLAREDIERFMAPVQFPSVDPRRLHCKKFASIKKFVQEKKVMRIVGCVSESEEPQSKQSVSSLNEPNSEEEKHGEMSKSSSNSVNDITKEE